MSHELQNYFVLLGNSGDNAFCVKILFVVEADVGLERFFAAAQDTDAQLQWLDSTLAQADEDWVVVVGHHPIYADTDKSEAERTDMQKRVDPILRRHKVDMYICGHIHNFQHIRCDGSETDYVVNTSGSKTRVPNKTEGTVFCSDVPGFSVLTADKNSLKLNMLDKNGNPVHTVTREK